MRALWLAAALAAPSAAKEVPYLGGRVNDEAGILGPAADRLERTLKDYELKTGRQFAVLTVASLEGEALEDYSLKVARTWKLGRAGKDDGILLLVARDDRKVRLEVGYGLEGDLPDALAGRIIRGEILPRFRSGDYPGGVEAGVRAALLALDKQYSPLPEPAPAEERGRGRNDFASMGLLERVMVSFFVVGILGVFEALGIGLPGVGWFLYFFLIPFWAAFPMAIWGAKIGSGVLAAHLIGFPLAKLWLPRTERGRRIVEALAQSQRRGRAGSVGGWGGGGGWSSGGGGGGFSGGGGSFGGGGASGSW